MTLASLIERVEKAEAGNFALEIDIWAALGSDGVSFPPPFTADPGEAMRVASLLLPEWELSLAQRKPRPGETCAEWWDATLFRIGGGYVTANKATPALALVLAVLRAKEGGA